MSTPRPMSLIDFTGRLLHHVIMKAETTEIWLKKDEKVCTISAGTRVISGENESAAFDNFLTWIATRTPDISPEKYAAMDLDEKADDGSKELIEELTKEGMTEFGMQVEKLRKAREGKVHEILEDRRARSMSLRPAEVLADIHQFEGELSDLDLEELRNYTATYLGNLETNLA